MDFDEVYVMQGEYKLNACMKKMLRAEVKAKGAAKISSL